MKDTLARVPPQDLYAEEAVIGGILIKNELFDVVAEILEAEHFYRETHRTIWHAMAQLAAASRPIEIGTLRSVIGSKTFDEIAGKDLCAEAAANVGAASAAPYYAREVRDRATQRAVLSFGTSLVERAFAAPPPGNWTADWIEELIAEAEYGVAQIVSKQISRPESAKDVAIAEAIYELRHGEGKGIATGFADLDGYFGGFDKGHLTIIAARTSLGKTAIATNFGINAAKADVSTAYFTLEMSAKEMWVRALGTLAEADTFLARRYGFTAHEIGRIDAAEKMLNEMPLRFLYRPAMRPSDLRHECRRLQREVGLNLAIVDYFNLMRGNRRERDRWREMQEVILTLKEIAGELNIPLVLLSQLNREGADDKEPSLRNLRDTGSAEEHASNVLFLWQPNPPARDAAPDWEPVEIIIGKQRNGPAGKPIKMEFRKAWGGFRNA